MSVLIRIICLTILCICSVIMNGQTLHKLSKDLPQVNKEFQLNVYVVLDSLGNAGFVPSNMDGQVANANEMFSPIGVSFAVCRYQTIPDYNFNVIAEDAEFIEQHILWRKNKMINVYIHEKVAEDEVTCGFAGLGQIAVEDNAYVVLKKSCEVPALAHELGHLFGLLHTFEGNGNENVDGSNCETTGDLICDTPADPFDIDALISWQNNECEFTYSGLDANGEYYQPDVGNIMSYYECRCGFTYEQYLKMANNYLNSSKRIW